MSTPAEVGSLRWVANGEHPDRFRRCPYCGVDLLRGVALVDIAYLFVPCDCPAAEWVHLVEQVWHRDHLAAAAGEDLAAQLDERSRIVADTRREALAEAQRVVMAEARRGVAGAPGRQSLTYTGGLRRAARVLDPLLSAAAQAAKPAGGDHG